MEKVINASSGHHRRDGDQYNITEAEIHLFHKLGYLVLNDVLTEAEMQTIDPWFDHFISGKEADRMGRDFCDMSQPYGAPIEEFQLVNAMLPSTYCPELVDNIFFRIAQNIADQLYFYGKPAMDYEQFLAKKPSRAGAVFAMHQDLGYWPKTKNTWTATFSLALSDSDLINGCLQVIPGSNREPALREHTPKSFNNDSEGGSSSSSVSVNRDESHALVIETKPTDKVVYLPVKRGSLTIHDERIVHGSAGNLSDHWRKTYVMAFRDVETIREERAIGFTHSHNDKVDWDKIIK